VASCMNTTPAAVAGALPSTPPAKESTHPIATNSPPLRRMLDDLTVAAAHDVTILLIGETGSGKTWLSKLIHESSPRRNEPFLHVACGALPRDLIESELFGHVKGAFTSAHADKDGKFIAARKGTILLDEIDVLGPEQQVKLLRVIETGEFEQVGSNRTLKSQARLVVASNLDLQPLVEQGRFRPDLYYRLNMLKFDLPPLRKRKADIVPLAQEFIARFQEKHGVKIQSVDAGLLDALMDYPWPGNVRELEHVIQRAIIYCRDGILTAAHLPPHILAGQAGPANDPSVQLGSRPMNRDPSLGSQVAITERDIIEQALSRNNFSRTVTARELGISRVTLYNKMRKYQMMK
jgi:DNA-binding NtrC family response regulator